MATIQESIYDLRLLDELARDTNPINDLHPLVKLTTTAVFLVVVVSYDRYQVSGLLPLLLYPVVIYALSSLPLSQVLKRIGWVLPLLIGIGIFNPLFDNHQVDLLGRTVSAGWLTFLSILLKGVLTVAAAVLLIATTGIDRLGWAMRMIKIPKLLVLQLLLTYRYIGVLGEELARMLRAYSLRAPGQKGIKAEAWGSFAGGLLLRSFDRAQRVYAAMVLRGFDGDYHVGQLRPASRHDAVFMVGWSLYFVVVRMVDIPVWLGSLLVGGLNR
ncbi:MAG: cobalt ECF transporter T component CbiQ [Syntrophomonas sp.]|nr:cobalt ECF transporter T component CbiQ [Syntrophomonas sp.]